MPKIEKLPSGSFRMRVTRTDEFGKKITQSFTAPTKEEVRLKAHAALSQEITVGQAVDDYIALRAGILSPKTISEYRKMRSYRFKCLHDVKCSKMTPAMLQRAVSIEAQQKTIRGSVISQKTLKNAVGLYGPAIKAVNGNFDYSAIMYPQKTPVRYNTPDADKLKEIYELASNTKVEIPVLLASQCSLRLSEVMGLTWENVHETYIDVVQAKIRVDGQDIIKPTKNESSTRRVALPSALSQKLEALRKPSGFVVQFTYPTIQDAYRSIVGEKTGVKFHELRHAYASHLKALGVPDKYVQKMGGWKTDTTLKRVYQQTFSAQEAEFSSIADKFFSEFVSTKK